MFLKVQTSLFQVMTWCLQETSHYLHQCWVRSPNIIRPQAPVPLTVFRSIRNSVKIWITLIQNVLSRTHLNLAHVTTVSLSSHVQNFVVIDQICDEQEHCKFSLNFDFDRNIVSVTGARILPNMQQITPPQVAWMKLTKFWKKILRFYWWWAGID